VIPQNWRDVLSDLFSQPALPSKLHRFAKLSFVQYLLLELEQKGVQKYLSKLSSFASSSHLPIVTTGKKSKCLAEDFAVCSDLPMGFQRVIGALWLLDSARRTDLTEERVILPFFHLSSTLLCDRETSTIALEALFPTINQRLSPHTMILSAFLDQAKDQSKEIARQGHKVLRCFELYRPSSARPLDIQEARKRLQLLLEAKLFKEAYDYQKRETLATNDQE
jgi:hypothetical protein